MHWRSTLRGILAAPHYLASRTVDYALDAWAGVDTAGKIGLEELGFAANRGHQYTPAGWFVLGRVLRKSDISPGDVFIDFGSGKGRILLVAARYPFKKVIGVELSGALNQIAQRNIKRSMHRLACRDIQLVTSDVLDYTIPDDLTVAFFNNPFSGATFTTVIDNIRDSLARRPRDLRIIYVKPTMHEALIQRGFLLFKRARGVWMYRNES